MHTKKSPKIKKFFRLPVLIFLALTMSMGGCTANNKSENSDSAPSIPPPSKYANFPTVIIDAGHGGEDGGAIGDNGVFEKDINLAVALQLEEMLRSMGVNTRLTRDTDTLLYDRNSDYKGHKKAQDAAARIAIASEYESAIFLSIHMNSFPQKKYRGLQVYYSASSDKSQTVAEEIQSLTVKNLQPDNTRKIKPIDKSVYILNKIEHPAVLVECGFISNAEECALLCNTDYQNKLCLVICGAVLNYFDSVENNNVDST